MASITTDIHTPAHGFRARIAGWGAALRRAFEAHARAASRRDAIEALEAKSDAELAALGLRRDEIVYHVFRDRFYA